MRGAASPFARGCTRALWLLAVCGAAGVLPAGARAQQAPDARCAPGEAPEACFRRALRVVDYANPDGVARSHAALRLLDDVCNLGLADGCYFKGRLLLTTVAMYEDDRAGIDSALTESATVFRRGCVRASPTARPSAAACNSLGDAYELGMGVPAHPDSALAYYHLGCALGSSTACAREAARLGRAAELGPAREAAGQRQSAAACVMGSPSGCATRAAYRVRRLRETPPSLRRTTAFAGERDAIVAEQRRLCRAQRSQLAACAELGDIFADPALGVVDRDSARSYYEIGCRGQGQASAQQWLGVGAACRGLAALALATRRDTAAAMRFHAIGCALSDMDACVEQGRLAQRLGQGADERAGRAHQLYLFVSACMAPQPSAAGCRAAGTAFLRRHADTTHAKRFYRTACDLGDGMGCNGLGTLERGPRGDSAAVLKYYRRGCAYGAGPACVNLAAVVAEWFEDEERADRLLRRRCGLGSAAECWRLMNQYADMGDEENAGVHRAAACRASRAYCKAAAATDPEEEP